MDQRLANAWRMTVNEKKFIETALLSDLRVDGRRPFDYRRITIKFGRFALKSYLFRGFFLVFMRIYCFFIRLFLEIYCFELKP